MSTEAYGHICTGQEILASRDARAARQRAWLAQTSDCCLISATMNIAGPCKRSALIDQGFDLGMQMVEQVLDNMQVLIHKQQRWHFKTGCEAFFLVHGEARSIKRIMIWLEEATELGRLLDLDVLDERGAVCSRSDLGLGGRKCLICSYLAYQCARLGRHSSDELVHKTEQILRAALDQTAHLNAQKRISAPD
jgi:holo-ACP synthase CitX